MSILDAFSSASSFVSEGIGGLVETVSDLAGGILAPVEDIFGLAEEVAPAVQAGFAFTEDPEAALSGLFGIPVDAGGGGALPAADFAPLPTPVSLPASLVSAGGGGGVQPAGLVDDVIDMVPDALGIFGMGAGSEMEVFLDPSVAFRASPSGCPPRARSMLHAINPATGKLTTWKNMGRPILYSGDMAAKKRVDRVARQAARGRRRPR